MSAPFRKSIFRTLLFFSLLSGACAAFSAAPPAPPPDFDTLVQRSLKACDRLKDYTCVFHRRERIGNAFVEQRNIRAKFMKPSAVLMAWTEGKMKGTESLYF